MKRIILLALLLCAMLNGILAQKLVVEEMKSTNDLSASQYRRKDLVGEACALVKVQLTAKEVGFEGNVIQPVEYKGGEYWVYMTKGSRELRIKHLAKSPTFVPCHISFGDYGITGLESLATYNLTLLLPQGAAIVQTQKLTINYTPANAIVLVDSEPHQGNGHLELVLPVGFHNYQVVAVGYETAEGSVKLTANQPRSITEHLVATQSQPAQSVAQENISPVVQQTSTEKPTSTNTSSLESEEDPEINGKTAQQICDLGSDYHYGVRGRVKDYAKAVKYYRIAADRGNVDAQFELGLMYNLGDGIKRDVVEAVKWYRKAAEQGSKHAQHNLGTCYEYGVGVGSKDLSQAKFWYEKAAAQGDEEAKKKLSELSNVISNYQVSRNEKIFDVVETMPRFKGTIFRYKDSSTGEETAVNIEDGPSGMYHYLSLAIKYPVEAEKERIQGRVVCTFVVEKDGSITDVKVIKSVDPSLDKEAVRVLSSMPKWEPGKQNDSPVRVKYTITVTFKL